MNCVNSESSRDDKNTIEIKMKQWIIVYLLVAYIHLSHQRSTSDSPTYRAAVLNYSPKYIPNNAKLTLDTNCAEYIKLIQTAQTLDVDIIVFPEYGLTSINLLTISDIYNWTTKIPYLVDNYVPCAQRDEAVNDVLIKLSCAAKLNHIYVVINIAERAYSFKKNKIMYYSTNVVFDRTGRITAKYRKMYRSNNEPQSFDFPLWEQTEEFLLPTQNEAIFNTDFGVTFATFTSYDILFYEIALHLTRKKNITDIVNPTLWHSETPFLTATQVEAGWSFSENVNLLTSSYNRPNSSNTGGGVYLGHKGIGRAILPAVDRDLLITYDVPKINRSELKYLKSSSFDYYYQDTVYNTTKQKIRQQTEDKNKLCKKQENDVSKEDEVFLYRDYNDAIPLENNTFQKTVCHDNFCCKFKGHIEKVDPCINYRFVIFKKLRPIFDIESGVLTCSIIQCSSNAQESCGSVEKSSTLFEKLKITAEFQNDKNLLIMPSTLNSNLLPVNNWTYSENVHGDDMSVTISLNKKTDNIVTFGLYLRNFSTDQTILNENQTFVEHVLL